MEGFLEEMTPELRVEDEKELGKGVTTLQAGPRAGVAHGVQDLWADFLSEAAPKTRGRSRRVWCL